MGFLICTKCSQQIADDAHYCGYCGNQIQSGSRVLSPLPQSEQKQENERADFRGVFSATINTPGQRVGFLVTGIILWTICGVAISGAIGLVFSPLSDIYSTYGGNWFFDDFIEIIRDANWSEVHWVFVVICLIVAFFAYGLGSSPMRAWKALRKRPDGIIGNGLRVLPDSVVELGHVELQPASFQEIAAKGRARVRTFDWKTLASYSREREILINVMRTAERGLMLGHIVLTIAGGQEAMFLEFIKIRIANKSDLWVAKESEINCLNLANVEEQLETVSSVLAPIPHLNGGRLTLTVTEFAASDNEAGGGGVAFGAIGGAAAGLMLVSATNKLQTKANEQLAGNSVPLGFGGGDRIVNKYGYELKPNVNAKRFRGW